MNPIQIIALLDTSELEAIENNRLNFPGLPMTRNVRFHIAEQLRERQNK